MGKHFTAQEHRCIECTEGRHWGQVDPFDPGEAADWYCVDCFVNRFGWFPWNEQGLQKMKSKGPPKSKMEKNMQKRHKPDKKELRKAMRANPLYHRQADVNEAILRSALSDMLPGLSIAASTSPSSEIHEATTSVDMGSVCASIISDAGSEAKCYMHGTCLRSENGYLIRVEDIREHDVLLAVDGTRVEVLSNRRHASIDHQMVWLQTDNFRIALTMSHRVMVLRGTTQRQTIPACHLRVGDPVLAEGGPQPITHVQHFLNDGDVYEIMFKPDAEMVTVFIDEGDNLLTKGKHNPILNRRGGMKKSCASAE